MDVNDIGKMILDGNVIEIIMRELQIGREQAIRLWYGSYTRNRVYAATNDQMQINAKICYEELRKEQGESDEEENTHS